MFKINFFLHLHIFYSFSYFVSNSKNLWLLFCYELICSWSSANCCFFFNFLFFMFWFMLSVSFWWFCSVAACTLYWHWFWSSLLKIIPYTIQIRQSPLRTATLLCHLRSFFTLLLFCWVYLTPKKSVKQSPWRSKVAVLYRLCLICIVNTFRIKLLKTESIILSTHYNKIEFWTLPIRSRRSRKHRWNLHHLLPHPQKTLLKSDSEKGNFFFELFYLLLAWLLEKE